MMGRWQVLLLALLIATGGPAGLISPVFSAGAANAQTLEVIGEDDAQVERVRFAWSGNVRYSAERFGDVLILRFSRPVTAPMGGAASVLGDFVTDVRPGGDRGSVFIRMSGNHRWRVRREGNAVVAEVYGATGPEPPVQAASTASAAPATTPPPTVPSLGVRTGRHAEYDRIVFDWTAPVNYTIETVDGGRQVIFDREVRIDDAAVQRRLPTRLSGFRSRSDSGRTVVTVPVPDGSDLRVFKSGPKVVADVTKGGGAPAQQASAAPTPAPAAATAPVSTPAPAPATAPAAPPQPAVPAAAAPPQPAQPTPAVPQATATTTAVPVPAPAPQVPAPAAPAPSAAVPQQPTPIPPAAQPVQAPAASPATPVATAALPAPPTSPTGATVPLRVEDLASLPPARLDQATTPVPAAPATGAIPAAPATGTAAPPSATAPQAGQVVVPGATVGLPQAVPPPPGVTLDEAGSPVEDAALAGFNTLGTNAATANAPGLVARRSELIGARIDGPRLPVQSIVGETTSTLRFIWAEPAAAAVFKRGSAMWIAFDRPALFDLSAVDVSAPQIASPPVQIPAVGGSVLRIDVIPGMSARVRRDGSEWIVDLLPRPARPDVPLAVERQMVSPQGPRIFIPIQGVSPTILTSDPAVGDQLFIAAIAPLGRAIENDRRFVNFSILDSEQGIAVVPANDEIEIRVLPDGVAITKNGGLAISRPSAGEEEERIAIRTDGLPPGLAPGRIFDVASWRGPGELAFFETSQRLAHEIAETPGLARSRPRLELAQFNFAMGLGAEALGIIRLIEKDDPDLGQRPDVQAMKGSAQFMLGRFDEAAQTFSNTALDGFSEAELWRGATAAARGRWTKSVEHFARAGEIPGDYHRSFTTALALLAAEATVLSGDFRGAGRFLDVVAAGRPSISDQSRLEYLGGRVLYAAGEIDEALERWRRLVEGDDRWARVRARRSLIEHDLQQGNITRLEALEELKTLRFAWRGDSIEFELLRDLGRLFIGENQYVAGLSALRQAVTYFPNEPRARAVTQEMTDAFAEIFTGGTSDQMEAISALSLYDQFRELTPVGKRGDEIIQRLADRLVQVDLLDRAAILLERQVKFRLRGADKARVGARLAVIRLLDRQPKEAIAALDESVAPGLDAELARERRRLRSRAEFELGDPRTALRRLRNDRSRDADLIRADIFWRTQTWPQAASVLGRLVGDAGRDGRRLDDRTAQLVLNWTVALSLSENLSALAEVRQRFSVAMDATPFREAFRIISNRNDNDPSDFRTLVSRFDEISGFQAFLSSYRDKIKDAELPQ